MRAIIQRVTEASVTVEGSIISKIGQGICVLIGIERDDGIEDEKYIKNKILNLRLWPNPETGKPWDKSVLDMGYEVLCVSQFTLHAVLKGNRFDFHNAMNPQDAPLVYGSLVNALKSDYNPYKIKDGEFGAMMNVQIANDGPVTISIDSRKKKE
uniref:D-aminoacyl-tRNA deacylase n=1 Tax=Parastrongyloides trichosuri TaxID=131310 RepID=A0A0N4Z0Q6_PARTI